MCMEVGFLWGDLKFFSWGRDIKEQIPFAAVLEPFQAP